MADAAHFRYGKKEIDHLSARDPKLGEVIRKTGKIKRAVNPDLFASLVENIVCQQISKKAAITVNARLRELCGQNVSPETIARIGETRIQQCGMTLKKATNICIAAESILNGKIRLHEFHRMPDDEVIANLVLLPGIGIWTAEMLMLFSLQRSDILSYDDLIIRRAIQKLHGLEKLGKKDFGKFRELYSPYGSTASLYLWAFGHSSE